MSDQLCWSCGKPNGRGEFPGICDLCSAEQERMRERFEGDYAPPCMDP